MSLQDDPAEMLGDRTSAETLRKMDESTARKTLSIDELQRWQKVRDLHESAEQTREEWRGQEERVGEIVVHADISELGTEVTVYGNDLLVHLDPEDRRLRDVADDLQDEYGDTDPDEVSDLSDDEIDDIAASLIQIFDLIIRRWDGTPWRQLRDDRRRAILEDAREKWKIDGLLVAFAEVVDAVERDREEKLEVIDGFRE